MASASAVVRESVSAVGMKISIAATIFALININATQKRRVSNQGGTAIKACSTTAIALIRREGREGLFAGGMNITSATVLSYALVNINARGESILSRNSGESARVACITIAIEGTGSGAIDTCRVQPASSWIGYALIEVNASWEWSSGWESDRDKTTSKNPSWIAGTRSLISTYPMRAGRVTIACNSRCRSAFVYIGATTESSRT
jgi:hypothetical protein